MKVGYTADKRIENRMLRNKDIDSSDSEDEIDEAPAFLKRIHLDNDTDKSSKTGKQKISRLDALVAEHKREEEKQAKLKAARDSYWRDIENGAGAECEVEELSERLAPEHADSIENLKTMPSTLRRVQPGITVFQANKFCCLFNDRINPIIYFKKRDSTIDKFWSSYSPDDASIFMFVSTLIFPYHTSPNFDGIMQWLMDLMSIHHSDITAYSIMRNMLSILNKLQLTRVYWKPTVLGLLRLLVNLGADPQELIYSKKLSPLEMAKIREHLIQVPNENIRQQSHSGQLSGERFQAVLHVLSAALQGRSVVDKEELSFMFYMLAKAALDPSLYLGLAEKFHICFSAVVDHYSDAEWPAVVPELCRELSHVSDHHHNQVYLAELLPAGSRGSYLKIRFSYMCLCSQLLNETAHLEDSRLQDLQIMDVATLGKPVLPDQPSTLAVTLHDLVFSNQYKAFSVLKLLDMSVGDAAYEPTMKKDHLEYLMSQVSLVQKTIKDKVSQTDFIKIKDVLHNMRVKWSLILQHQRMKEGSIFPWATATSHRPVTAEILTDGIDESVADEHDDAME